MKTRNWDTETADKCRLPEFIPDICDRCRDYNYCHRQMTLEDMARYMNPPEGGEADG